MVVELTAEVFTVKVPVVLPTATVRDAATVALAELLISETMSPPVGAGELRVTVPLLDFPPFTDVGLSVTDTITGGVIVRVADCIVPFKFAVSTAAA